MLIRTQGIVLRSTDYGEANSIISLFTADMGKISVMVRGGKRMKSPHSASVQLFTYGDYMIFRKGGQMGSLNQGEIIKSHHALREDLVKAAYSSYVAEMADRLTPENEPNPMLFEQVNAALTAIGEDKDPDIVVHIIEMKMLALAGYLPQLDECVSCGRDDGSMALSVSQGGVLCPRCRAKDPSAIDLAPGSLKLLRLFQRVDLRRLGSVEVKPETKAQLKQAMRSFMDVHTGTKWKARGFLEQMEKYGF